VGFIHLGHTRLCKTFGNAAYHGSAIAYECPYFRVAYDDGDHEDLVVVVVVVVVVAAVVVVVDVVVVVAVVVVAVVGALTCLLLDLRPWRLGVL